MAASFPSLNPEQYHNPDYFVYRTLNSELQEVVVHTLQYICDKKGNVISEALQNLDSGNILDASDEIRKISMRRVGDPGYYRIVWPTVEGIFLHWSYIVTRFYCY